MKTKLFILIFLIALPTFSLAQEKINEKEMVGFACFYEGKPSKPVAKISKLVYNSKYNAIVKLLDSPNKAYQYLAVVVLERLHQLDRLQLTQVQQQKINILYNSEETISSCSGCTYFEKISIKESLNKKHTLRKSANYWLKNELNLN